MLIHITSIQIFQCGHQTGYRKITSVSYLTSNEDSFCLTNDELDDTNSVRDPSEPALRCGCYSQKARFTIVL
ncbi:hypothetical protein E2C01_037820 [Portunus trituberculatus]|uniref:Uncharacterized protein n=1 Tax=Portunus trituberculatus TaxID=210409 RepID=A0A5B7FFL8_PORTR|nr:hypothetical protein [Portunus trituberculatus]